MLFRRLRAIKGAPGEEETPRQKQCRFLLVLLLSGAVFWGFWQNSADRLEGISLHRGRNSDGTGTLPPREVRKLRDFAEKFHTAYGVYLDVRIQNDPFPPVLPPGVNGKTTVFLGISPTHRQVFLSLPPLAMRTLDQKLITHLQNNHFTTAFARGAWPDALNEALNMLAKEFDRALAIP